jgi:ornithine cyclodeaminase
MKVLIVNQTEVRRLLPMAQCIEAMGEAFAALGRGEATLPLRQVLRLPGGQGVLGTMPAQLAPGGALGLKVITVFQGNHGTELDSHQGAILLFESERGRLLAILDATSVTAIRTAAVSALATRLLARPDAGDLALLGTGVEARTHLEALSLVRRLRRVRAVGRDSARLHAFAAWAASRLGIAVEPRTSVQEAVAAADLICAVTSSHEPVLKGAWISPGTHVNAVGACVPTARELDTSAVVRSRLFVDRRESALNEAGDILIPKREGALGDDHIQAELADVVLGRHPGRGSDAEVTLFKALGLAVEDVAAAEVVHRNAVAQGAGTWIELGGGRDAA